VRSALRREIDHTVGRLLDLVGIALPERLVRRWEGARATLTVDEDRE
jgi:3-polyprenyl-4-hydroxybenzoate decarboxylase